MKENECSRFLVKGRISSQDSYYYLHYVLLKCDLCASEMIGLQQGLRFDDCTKTRVSALDAGIELGIFVPSCTHAKV